MNVRQKRAEAVATAQLCPKCGAGLRRNGCPALCEPVEDPAPQYTGPALVGRTHTQRLIEMSGPGWIR
jgi:hypothetical protein